MVNVCKCYHGFPQEFALMRHAKTANGREACHAMP